MKKSIWKKLFPWVFGVFIALIAIASYGTSCMLSMTHHYIIEETETYQFVLISQNDTITGYAYYPFRAPPLLYQRKNVMDRKMGIVAYSFCQNQFVEWIGSYEPSELVVAKKAVQKSGALSDWSGVRLPEDFFPDESLGEIKLFFDSPNRSSGSITKNKYSWTKARNDKGEEFEYTVVEIVLISDERGWDAYLRDPYNRDSWRQEEND